MKARTKIPEAITRVLENTAKVVIARPQTLELTVVALLCEGHILIEDVPGIGKTTLAKALARSLGGSFHRIQCTPDLLPGDITGVYFFNQKKGEFEFRPGPVMSNVLLVDEINRATPRTQSSLLECMEERQVTVEGVTTALPRPFLVIATQNPVELQGTFPLPEAQLDRFLMKVTLGYPGRLEEDGMLLRFEHDNPLEKLEAVTTPLEMLRLRDEAQRIFVEPSVRGYMLDIVTSTRDNPSLGLGASPRASLALYKACQALALVQGREFVIPDDVKRLAVPVLAHRLALNTEAYLHQKTRERLLEEILASVPAPVE
jgi:MoxR-like ATPase